MTIYQYLNTLTADPGDPAAPALSWYQDELTPEEEADIGLWPYVVVDALDENPREHLYNGVVITEQVIDVAIYQKPNAEGETPARESILGVWEMVTRATQNVTENTYKRRFISLELGPRVEPRFDRATGGLFGSVRFRLKSYRN